MNIREAREFINEKLTVFKKEAHDIMSAVADVNDKIDFHSCDLKLSNYQVFCTTIIDGNFEVTNLLEDAINDHSLLIVLGNLTISRAIIMSQVIITGDLIIKDIAAFDSKGDYALCVGGNVSGKYYIESDHIEKVKGKWNIENSFERGGDPRGVLVTECIYDEEYHDFNIIAQRIRQKLPVFITKNEKD